VLPVRIELTTSPLLADGQPCAENSLNVLREALHRGYELGIQKDKTITVTKPEKGFTSYLRSNSDIQRFCMFEKFR
jgi:hypothetical protein